MPLQVSQEPTTQAEPYPQLIQTTAWIVSSGKVHQSYKPVNGLLTNFFLLHAAWVKVPGGTPFTQRSQQATAYTDFGCKFTIECKNKFKVQATN